MQVSTKILLSTFALAGAVMPALAADSVTIDLTSMRIANGVNQTRTSSPATIDPAFKYFVDFSDNTMVRGDSGLLAFTYPTPVPLAQLLESFSPGSSASLHSVSLNPDGTHPFTATPQVVSGTSSGITITMTIGAQINASNIASFNITQVTLSPGLVGSLRFTSGSITISRGCLGDFNNDGGVDGSDIASFFITWETGDPLADLNADGGVDGGDIQAFFEHWDAGC
ncbi:MAG: hypothetical protein NTV94_13970 [Planctomycetota bacterium]|nr:hypothetical protein [Planctomycetota bacterium]